MDKCLESRHWFRKIPIRKIVMSWNWFRNNISEWLLVNINLIPIIRHTFFTLSSSRYHFTSLPASAMFHYRSFHSFVHQESQVTERRKAESKSPQHKYLRHSISLRLYKFHFTGSISAYHTATTSANATFAQSKPIVRFISFLLYPCFFALLFCLPTMLCFIYCGYA